MCHRGSYRTRDGTFTVSAGLLLQDQIRVLMICGSLRILIPNGCRAVSRLRLRVRQRANREILERAGQVHRWPNRPVVRDGLTQLRRVTVDQSRAPAAGAGDPAVRSGHDHRVVETA